MKRPPERLGAGAQLERDESVACPRCQAPAGQPCTTPEGIRRREAHRERVEALATPCGIPWAVCPSCLGVGLVESAGAARCPRCDRRWSVAQVTPCPSPATVKLVDDEGTVLNVCASHAQHPSAAGMGPACDVIDLDVVRLRRTRRQGAR